MTPFDASAGVILICLAAVLNTMPLMPGRRGLTWLAVAGGAVFVACARLLLGAEMALEAAGTMFLVLTGISAGLALHVRREWPAGAFLVAIAVVTAAGAYLRAEPLAQIFADDRPLGPDASYYQDQALRTANPWAAGQKSPLWPALAAPVMRMAEDSSHALRALSWAFGILMVPAVAWGLGRLFDPVAGIMVAGTIAVDGWLIDLSTQGLREELGVCLWMAVLVLLFDRAQGVSQEHRPPAENASHGPPVENRCHMGDRCHELTWGRAIAAGLAAGALLLLRNTDIPVLMLLMVYALLPWPISRLRAITAAKAIVGISLPVLLLAPFYVNQGQTYGDPFYLEKRDTRYHVNAEFMDQGAPPDLPMPSEEAYARDRFTGEPVSPAAYLLKYHSFGDFLHGQWIGLKRTVLGEPFATQASFWMQLLCAAGVVAALVSPRVRFAPLFIAGSMVGIRAHLIATHQLEQRWLVTVMIIWLACGWWLVTAIVRAGGLRWLRLNRPHRIREARSV